MSFKISKISAFISTDDQGEEGLCGMVMGDKWMPFICADEKRVSIMRPHAQNIADITGRAIKLIQFSVRTDSETLYPKVKK